jgi:hypothetical protein
VNNCPSQSKLTEKLFLKAQDGSKEELKETNAAALLCNGKSVNMEGQKGKSRRVSQQTERS